MKIFHIGINVTFNNLNATILNHIFTLSAISEEVTASLQAVFKKSEKSVEIVNVFENLTKEIYLLEEKLKLHD